MVKCLLIDFHDSFTFNIKSLLISYGVDTIVKDYKNICSVDKRKYDLFILGPGPGHPKDYHHFFPFMESLFKEKNKIIWGICLGHQLICLAQGAIISQKTNPIHGQAKKIIIPEHSLFPEKLWGEKFSVQYYNSLQVSFTHLKKNHYSYPSNYSDLYYRFSNKINNHILSYQFHPESIGTSCPKVFFDPLIGLMNYT